MAPAVLTEPPVLRGERPVDEEALYEIVDGQYLDLTPMSAYATWIASRLGQRLGPFVDEHALGTVVTEMLFVLDSRRNLRRRPDVAFVSTQRWPISRSLPESGDWDIVPDLAVEVVSPTDEFSDVVAKLREYFEYGVRRVWVILPEQRQVYVYDSPTTVRILSAGDSLPGGEILPGFSIPLASLFDRAVTV